MSNWDITCPDCGYTGSPFHWNVGYFCPQCEHHNDELYRGEHPDTGRARMMNRADIIQEYHEAGIAFSAEAARI